MAVLSRAQIDSRAQSFRDIDVPEWGGAVRIVPMSASDLQLFLKIRETDQMLAGAHVLARVMVDEDGARLYRDDEVPDLAALPGSAGVLATLLPEILALSGVDKERQAAIIKNSESEVTSGSSIASP